MSRLIPLKTFVKKHINIIIIIAVIYALIHIGYIVLEDEYTSSKFSEVLDYDINTLYSYNDTVYNNATYKTRVVSARIITLRSLPYLEKEINRIIDKEYRNGYRPLDIEYYGDIRHGHISAVILFEKITPEILNENTN